MASHANRILQSALQLSPVERAELIEQLLASFSFPDRKAVDALWAKEAEDRIEAFDRGDLSATPAAEVFRRIERDEV